MLSRQDARMVAEELYRLIRKDVREHVDAAVRAECDEWLDTRGAAELLGISVSNLKRNIDLYPHVKVGRLNKFRRSALLEVLCR